MSAPKPASRSAPRWAQRSAPRSRLAPSTVTRSARWALVRSRGARCSPPQSRRSARARRRCSPTEPGRSSTLTHARADANTTATDGGRLDHRRAGGGGVGDRGAVRPWRLGHNPLLRRTPGRPPHPGRGLRRRVVAALLADLRAARSRAGVARRDDHRRRDPPTGFAPRQTLAPAAVAAPGRWLPPMVDRPPEHRREPAAHHRCRRDAVGQRVVRLRLSPPDDRRLRRSPDAAAFQPPLRRGDAVLSVPGQPLDCVPVVALRRHELRSALRDLHRPVDGVLDGDLRASSTDAATASRRGRCSSAAARWRTPSRCSPATARLWPTS